MATNKSYTGLETLGNLAIIRGVVTVIFGVVVLAWPGRTLLTVATLISLWLLASGVTNIIHGLSNIKDAVGSILTFMVAALQLGVGAYLLQRPGITIATLVAFVALALTVDGIVCLVGPFVGSKSANSNHKVISMAYGAIAVLAGITLWRYPVAGTLDFLWIVGLFAVVTGPMWIVLGLAAKEQ